MDEDDPLNSSLTPWKGITISTNYIKHMEVKVLGCRARTRCMPRDTGEQSSDG